MKSTRIVYKDELLKIATINKKIFCIETDLGGHNNIFQKNFPERFLNIGIAEHTALGIASGLAKTGFVPFVHTFAPFGVFRAGEMVRLSMSYMNLNIKLICSYGGLSGAWFGPTHQCLEDLNIILSLPNILIAAPHGEQETRLITEWASRIEAPIYIRLGRNDAFQDLTYIDALQYPYCRRVQPWNINNNLALVSVGEIATEMVKNVQNIEENLHISHVHLPFLDHNALLYAKDILQDFEIIVVVEEVRKHNGIASCLGLLLPNNRIYSFAPTHKWISLAGEYEDILSEYDFTENNLKKLINNILKGDL